MLSTTYSAYSYNAGGFTPYVGPDLGLSGGWCYTGPGFGNVAFTRGSDVLCPSDMIAVGDSCPIDANAEGAMGFYMLMPYNGTDYELGCITPNNLLGGDPAANAAWIPRRHAGRWNSVFCDGHTEHGRTRVFFDPAQDNVVRRWYRDHQPHPELVKQQYPGIP